MTSAQQATFIHIWISPVRYPRRMQSLISSRKTPKYKKLSRKRKTAQNLSILSCFMMECRWWDSNPHGFPNDFESFASAIPPHRLIFNFGTLVPVSEDWRDVQEGCKKSCFGKPSKFNEHSWISRTYTENHEADFESPSSAIPTHRLMFRTLLIIPDSLPKIKTKNQRGNLPPAACFFCAGRWTEPAPGGILGADVLHHRRV